MPNIRVGSYVVATRDFGSIKEWAVGLVANTSRAKITVFFIGANKTVETDSNHIAYLDITKTGKPLRKGEPYPKKICNICHLLKDNSEFSINQTDAEGRKTTRPSCIECRREFIDGKALNKQSRVGTKEYKGTCIGCFWYDPAEFNAQVSAKFKKTK